MFICIGFHGDGVIFGRHYCLLADTWSEGEGHGSWVEEKEAEGWPLKGSRGNGMD